MLEKYIPDFDPDAFLQELAEEKQVTKKEALAMCRKAVPKELQALGDVNPLPSWTGT